MEIILPYLDKYLQWSFLGNTGREISSAAVLFIGLLIIFYIIKIYVLFLVRRWAKRTATTFDDAIVDGLMSLSWPFYTIISAYIASKSLVLPYFVDKTLIVLLLVIVTDSVIKQLSILIGWFVHDSSPNNDAQQTSTANLISKIVKIILWVVGILFILQNLGIQITPIIAALGVGGVAVAFALQHILEDLFSSFSIYFDKPFVIDDFIIVGDDMGVVKYIGLKSTRLQTLQGQELIISNRELTSARVNNYKHMNSRRIQFNFGVEYGTSLSQCEQINKLVTSVIAKTPHAKLDRTHFKEFGDSALIYEVVYYVDNGDYNLYMDTQQAINLSIKESFEKANISMAFPTRTVHIVKSG